MAKYVSSDVLDNGLNHIRNKTWQMVLLKSYSLADSAFDIHENVICRVSMTPSDFYILGKDGESRVLTIYAKNGTAHAASGPNPDLHIAFIDMHGGLIMVTDEITKEVIQIGNSIGFPTLTYTSNQPA